MNTFKFLFFALVLSTSFIACKNEATQTAPTANVPAETSETPIAKIDKEVQRLENNQQWAKVEEKELMVSSEGGTWKLYYEAPQNLRMAKADIYGETGIIKETYYLDQNKNIICFLSNQGEYNHHVNYSAIMQELEQEVQDVDIKVIDSTITKVYFDKGQILDYNINKGTKLSAEEKETLRINVPKDFETYMNEAY